FLTNGQTGGQPHKVRHLLFVADVRGLISDAHQQVARLQSRAGRGRILDHATEQNSSLVGAMLKERLSIQSTPAPLYLAVRHEVFCDAPGQIARNGAAQSKSDLVDANDFAT